MVLFVESARFAISATLPLFFEHNLAIGEEAVRKRRRGIFGLLVALLTYAGGYLYILSEVIG